MPKLKTYLPDVNVWLAFAVDTHVHHVASAQWMDSLSSAEAVFCRITQMGLLRLLTNPRVMHQKVLSQAQAWHVYEELQRDSRTRFLTEPEGIEKRWHELTRRSSPSNGLWTDCYLQAFAETAGLTVATFDKKLPGALVLA